MDTALIMEPKKTSNNRITKKYRFISKLTALSNDEKQITIEFFSMHPNFENLIDWNSKKLNYHDFEHVFSLALKSRTSRKHEVENNPRLLFKGHNCRIISQTDNYLIVVPLDWRCAVYFSSFSCGGENAKWCISKKDNSYYWDWYSKNEFTFFLIYFLKRHPTLGRKVMLELWHESNYWSFWLQENKVGWDILAQLPERLIENKVKNPFNVCWNLWAYHLESEKLRKGQLYLDFGLIDESDTIDKVIPDATFVKNVMPLLIYDNIAFTESKEDAFDDSSSSTFLYELTGTMSKSQLQLMYVLYLRQEGYKYWITSDGDVRFRIDNHSLYINIFECDTGTFCICYPNFWKIESKEEREKAALVVSNINNNSIHYNYYLNNHHNKNAEDFIAIYLEVKKNVKFGIIAYQLVNPSDFSKYFKRMLECMLYTRSMFIQGMKKYDNGSSLLT